MNPAVPRRQVVLYKTPRQETVRKELDKLGRDGKAAVLAAVRGVAEQRHLPREDERVDGRIRAVRTSFGGTEYRCLYALVGDRKELLLLLCVLNKKTRKLPPAKITLAKDRLAAWEAQQT